MGAVHRVRPCRLAGMSLACALLVGVLATLPVRAAPLEDTAVEGQLVGGAARLALPLDAGALLASPLGDVENQLLTLANHERERVGLPPLRMAGDLQRISRAWSQVMASTGLSEHNPDLPDQMCCRTRFGENVAWAGVPDGYLDESVAGVHGELMGSAPHRANILDPGFDDVGIGAVLTDGMLWVTQDFRQRDGSQWTVDGESLDPAPASAGEPVTDWKKDASAAEQPPVSGEHEVGRRAAAGAIVPTGPLPGLPPTSAPARVIATAAPDQAAETAPGPVAPAPWLLVPAFLFVAWRLLRVAA